MEAMTPKRCAIYTRKSTEEGLEQAFNSLDAQREACAAYILSQAHEGWEQIHEHYDDGGWSGGNMDRPGLKQLLADVAAGKVDVIVVYKVDRLTRSLADFARIVDTARQGRRVIRQRNPGVQYDDQHGPADAERAALLRPVRAGGHQRTHPRQGRGFEEEGHVDGRPGAARLQARRPETA